MTANDTFFQDLPSAESAVNRTWKKLDFPVIDKRRRYLVCTEKHISRYNMEGKKNLLYQQIVMQKKI